MSPERTAWNNMKQRCLNAKNPGYRHYGGRGISICAQWLASFEVFFADMGRRPPGRSIDRINNNGDYEPGNCRWATAKQQANNQRRRQGSPKPRRPKCDNPDCRRSVYLVRDAAHRVAMGLLRWDPPARCPAEHLTAAEARAWDFYDRAVAGYQRMAA